MSNLQSYVVSVNLSLMDNNSRPLFIGFLIFSIVLFRLSNFTKENKLESFQNYAILSVSPLQHLRTAKTASYYSVHHKETELIFITLNMSEITISFVTVDRAEFFKFIHVITHFMKWENYLLSSRNGQKSCPFHEFGK